MEDRAKLVGHRAKPFRGTIEAAKVIGYARALQLRDAIHHDHEAAVRAGHRGIVVPHGFLNPFSLQPREAKFDTFQIDERRALAGQWSWECIVPVCAGDELHGYSELVSVEHKDSKRPMAVYLIDTHFFDRADQRVATVRDLTLEYLA